MKKATIRLILGSIVTALLLMTSSYFLNDLAYFQEIYDTIFILGTMHLFYFSGKAVSKPTKSAECTT